VAGHQLNFLHIIMVLKLPVMVAVFANLLYLMMVVKHGMYSTLTTKLVPISTMNGKSRSPKTLHPAQNTVNVSLVGIGLPILLVNITIIVLMFPSKVLKAVNYQVLLLKSLISKVTKDSTPRIINMALLMMLEMVVILKALDQWPLMKKLMVFTEKWLPPDLVKQLKFNSSHTIFIYKVRLENLRHIRKALPYKINESL